MEHNRYYHQLKEEIEEVVKQQELNEEASIKLTNKVWPIIKSLQKNNDVAGLRKLSNSLPDCIAKFYVFQAIEELKEKEPG